MGILLSHLHLLAIEQVKHPIKGDVLTLGQQAVWGTLEDVKNIFISHGLKPKPLKEGFDTKNKIPCLTGTPRGEFTNADAVLALLGAERVFAADISDYENPDYLIDLNYDINEEYYERFDVILDSGTLEHVFDVPTALSNLVKMVKKGGRIILILPSSNAINHGFYSFSPTLFFDFFAANGFSNFNCYLIEKSRFNSYKKSKIYRYNYFPGPSCPLFSKNSVEVCFCATKNNDINFKKINKPIQGMYLASDWFKKKREEPASKKSEIFEIIKNLIQKIEFSTRKFRPDFVDVLYKLYKSGERKKNLTYLGRF